MKNASSTCARLLDGLEEALALVVGSLSWLEQQDALAQSARPTDEPVDLGQIASLLDRLAGLLRDMDPDAEIAALVPR